MSNLNEIELASRSLDDNLFELRVTKEMTGIPAGAVRRGLVDAGRLTAICEATLQHELYDAHLGRAQLLRENPYLDESERGRLDSDGLIEVGSNVIEGTVLASIVSPSGRPQRGKVAIRDESWCVPFGWDNSQVIAVRRDSSAGRRREFPRGMLERLKIRLRRAVPFFPSDSLALGDLVVPTTGLMDDGQLPADAAGQPADLVVSNSIAEALGLREAEVRSVQVHRINPSAIDAMKARSIGPYSLITASPLERSTRRPGIMVTDNQLKWLVDRGLFGLVSEFVSLKSDDLQNRSILRDIALGAGDPTSPTGIDQPPRRADFQSDLPEGRIENPSYGRSVPAGPSAIVPAAPESFFELQEYLWGLGLGVDVAPREHCVAVSLRPASDAEILARSSGLVRKPETIHYQTYRPTPQGLFCETVFGPEQSPLRRRRSGHIELSEPIIPVIWRMGSQPILAGVLNIDPVELNDVIKRVLAVYVQNGVRVLRPFNATRPDEQLLQDGWTNLGTGCEAVKAILERTASERIPQQFGPAGERFFVRLISVVPPDLRPLVLLDSGNFATADINDLYRRVINRNNRLSKLKDLGAPAVIIHNEIRMLQGEVDCLQGNMFVPPRRQVHGSDNGPLKCLLGLITSRIIDEDGKRVEWAGEARAIAHAEISTERVGIPAMMFDELRLQNDQPVLMTTLRSTFVSRLPLRIDGPLIHLNHSDAAELLQENRTVAVHRPLTDAARHEAIGLFDGRPVDATLVRPFQPDDWCRHSDANELLDDLIATALTGTARQMMSARGLSLFGTGATTSEVCGEREKSDPRTSHGFQSHAATILACDVAENHYAKAIHWIDVPATAPKSPPSLDELASVIKGHRRQGCLFHLVQAVGDVSPNAGRIGGLPWMPRDHRWPCAPNGEPLEFVGQLPLDPAREAGLLPFDVPPGSLLTVFTACGDWENGRATREGGLSIHGTEDLIELNPPEADYETMPLCAIRAEICDLYPSLSDALEIIDWELDHPDPRHLAKLKEQYEELFPNPEDVTRVGGHPYWIQSPESISFVAQICSDGVSDLIFGDTGSLYIHGDSAENLSAFIQCY